MARRIPTVPLLLVLAVIVGGVALASEGWKVHRTKRGFRVGRGCQKMDESCAGTSTASVCRGGALAEVSCRGPAGCVDAPPQDVACDQTVAEVGDSCAKDGAVACSPAKDAQLACQWGVFVRASACPSHVCAVTITRRELGDRVKAIDTTAECQ